MYIRRERGEGEGGGERERDVYILLFCLEGIHRARVKCDEIILSHVAKLYTTVFIRHFTALISVNMDGRANFRAREMTNY